MAEDMLFADDDVFSDDASAHPHPNVWRILIADDEPDVHRITRMVLSGFQFDGRRLELISAYSGEETRQIMAENHDIAMILLDVVMEDDHAGLEVARYIREELNNRYTRIVLRTGQPGQAPEHEVIRTYDINDYKDKTELTTTKLNTLMYATLRSYRDICTLNEHRRGLERVITASAEVFSAGAINQFASAVLAQVTNLLGLEDSALYCSSTTKADTLLGSHRFRVLAATGDMQQLSDEDNFDNIPARVREGFEQAMSERKSQYFANHYIGYFASERGSESLLFVTYQKEPSELDKQLLEIYATNVAITYENLLMREEIIETQRELVYMLGEAVEHRSRETGAHVKRVAQISRLLAIRAGLSEQEAELIKLAAPLHDVGKIAIPDKILNKPGKHDPEEWNIMQEHAQIGSDILSKSDRRILQLAAIIAAQHHERWDGSGYPRGLQGEQIHIAGRIAAIADVFDALGSQRCYKDPWPDDQIIYLIQSESGKQFDPRLVELVMENLEDILAIRAEFPD
ncbi:MAG: phosphodiesterase [Oceanospirillaceae bacterium]|nr:phosphodiesterase [Oceanospirillaceae bacterium]MBT10479.1 phosphodiesterase [Oceanospirillaceae bacterium]|tara:strand:+ start:52415 stop:53962 length:1548 start_codon:yes stop_codon:yes gene_type:complete